MNVCQCNSTLPHAYIKEWSIRKLRLSPEIGNEISKARIEFLTDGIFAIVMTLLVLEITVPHLTHSELAAGELPIILLGLWPMILSYAMSFIILGFFWIYQHDLFHYIKRADRVFVWITIFYLMFVAFIPFSTALVGEYTNEKISVVVYGINIAVAALWTYVQWRYATQKHRLIDKDLDPTFITIISRRTLVGPILYLIGVALSFINTYLSIVLFIAIPIYYLVPARTHNSWFWFTRNK